MTFVSNYRGLSGALAGGESRTSYVDTDLERETFAGWLREHGLDPEPGKRPGDSNHGQVSRPCPLKRASPPPALSAAPFAPGSRRIHHGHAP
jgi:hypothetical protein